MLARVVSSTVTSLSLVLAACGGTSNVTIPPEEAPPGASPAGSGASAPTGEGPSDAGSIVTRVEGGVVAPPVDAGAPPPVTDAGTVTPAPDAGDLLGGLLGLTSTCVAASTGTYATDRSPTAAVPICKLNGGFFWTADLAIDCDGQSTAECNATTDPSYSDKTSFPQSNGQPLVASQLPWVVIPLPSGRFDYTKQNIQPGALAIVIYNGSLRYGVFGDEGPAGVIGEASWAMAKSLSVNTNPRTGGTAGPVTYFVLTGQAAVVSPIEDQTVAATLGPTLARDLIAKN